MDGCFLGDTYRSSVEVEVQIWTQGLGRGEGLFCVWTRRVVRGVESINVTVGWSTSSVFGSLLVLGGGNRAYRVQSK